MAAADADAQLVAERTARSTAILIVISLLIGAITTTDPTIAGVSQVLFLLSAVLVILLVCQLGGLHRGMPVILILVLNASVFLIWLVDLYLPASMTLNYLVLILFIASRLMSLRGTVVIAIGNGIVMILLNSALPQAQYLTTSLVFNILLSGAVIAVTYARQQDIARVSKSENRYRNLMQATYEPIVIADAIGIVLDCNSAFERLVQTPVIEIIGCNILAIITPATRPLAEHLFLPDSRQMVRVDVLLASGAIIAVELYGREHDYNGQPSVVIIMRPLLEETRLQRQQREYELRYKAIFDNTNDGIYILDLQGRYLTANPRGLEMFGGTHEALLGHEVGDFNIEEEKEKSRQTLETVIAQGSIPVYMRTFQRPNGDRFLGEVFAMLVRDQDETPLYIQSIVRDLTERERNAQSRLDLQMQRARNALLKQLIDDFSHHVRTPLSNIKNSSYLIERQRDNPAKHPHHLSVINAEVERLVKFLDDVLILTRIEAETLVETIQHLNLNDLLREIIPSPIGGANHDAQHAWRFSSEGTPVVIYGNRSRMIELLQRLLNNARIYTPSGGAISVAVIRHEVQRVVQISIEDTGIGIAPEDMPLIFENFYRSDNAREINPLSSGLGLAICHKIVAMQRGVISVESGLGIGSIFHVWLPLDLVQVLDYDTLHITPTGVRT